MMRRAQRHDGRPAMRGWSVKKLWACAGIVTLGCFTSLSITAQRVREEAPPPAAAVPTQNSADAPAGKSRISQEIQLTGDQHWVDSGLDVKAGERVILTASGKLRYADAPDDNGPEGRARGWRDLLKILPLNDAGRGAVLARIGDADSGQPFAVNQRRELTSRAAGRLSSESTKRGTILRREPTACGWRFMRLQPEPRPAAAPWRGRSRKSGA
ncbi:MAG TPA: hypothetical protein VHE23_06790 [Candidatus Acidoferrales bacterium]|nr:hypothetical protein [Candidatus Acidoferrales bacterium]